MLGITPSTYMWGKEQKILKLILTLSLSDAEFGSRIGEIYIVNIKINV